MQQEGEGSARLLQVHLEVRIHALLVERAAGQVLLRLLLQLQPTHARAGGHLQSATRLSITSAACMRAIASDSFVWQNRIEAGSEAASTVQAWGCQEQCRKAASPGWAWGGQRRAPRLHQVDGALRGVKLALHGVPLAAQPLPGRQHAERRAAAELLGRLVLVDVPARARAGTMQRLRHGSL